MLGNFFTCFCCRLLDFLNINFFKKFFKEHYQSVKWFGSRSGPTFCWSWSDSKLFSKIISRQQKLPLASKELSWPYKDTFACIYIAYKLILLSCFVMKNEFSEESQDMFDGKMNSSFLANCDLLSADNLCKQFGPRGYKLFSCSTQLSTKFQLLIKTKILTNE